MRERPRLRRDPEDERRAAHRVPGVRRPGRARPAPARRPLQGLGFYNTDYGKKKGGGNGGSEGSARVEGLGFLEELRTRSPPSRSSDPTRSRRDSTVPHGWRRAPATSRRAGGCTALRARRTRALRCCLRARVRSPSSAPAQRTSASDAAADRGGEDQLRHREEAHVADEGFRRVPADDRALDEVVGEAQRVGEAVLDPVDHCLLGLLAVEVVVAEA